MKAIEMREKDSKISNCPFYIEEISSTRMIGNRSKRKVETHMFPRKQLPNKILLTSNSLNSYSSLNNIPTSSSFFQQIRSIDKKETQHLRHFVISSMLALIFTATLTIQQNLCPKACVCDEQNLEITCRGNIGTSGIPHTLNPSAKRIFINQAQTSQFSGLDYLDKLETIDLSYNKISTIDFSFISKNINLISLNTSHNIVNEVKDSLVTSALVEQGYTTATLYESIKANDFSLPKFIKINVVNFIVSYNHLTIIRDFTFIRFHKLQKLDLSHNWISSLEPLSLFGLNKLESVNLRSNRLKQIPTLALHGTTITLVPPTYSLSDHTKPSSLKYLDFSENKLSYIDEDSFSLLEKVQELHLDSCLIETIHEQAFKGLHTLHLLSLNNNSLQEVPVKAFSYLGLLRQLRLNYNSFSHLKPFSFFGLASLEELYLNHGSLEELTREVFSGLVSLRKLELANNSRLARIEKGALDDLEKLNYISFYADSLTSFPINEATFHSLQYIDLRKNQLACLCDLKWLTRWLKGFNDTAYRTIQADHPLQQYDTPLHDENLVLSMTDLLNLTCYSPPALAGKLVINLPDNKLECLEPNSKLHVQLGFSSLFLITFIMTVVCLLNFCRNKKNLFVMLKENLVQNHISMMLPYSQNLHKNVDDLKKETQLYESDYEPIDYQQHGQVYNVQVDQMMYYKPQQNSQYI